MQKFYFLLALICLVLSTNAQNLPCEDLVNYRSDFSSGTMPDGWDYMWNSVGSIGTPGNYTPLLADGSEWHTQGGNGLPDTYNGSNMWLRLNGNGGHPGLDNKFAIAAYTIQRAGYYQINNAFVKLSNLPFVGDDGVEILIHINNESAIHSEIASPNSTLNIENINLGLRQAGDVVYVCFGPNGNHNRDYFTFDFTIEKMDTCNPLPANYRDDFRSTSMPNN